MREKTWQIFTRWPDLVWRSHTHKREARGSGVKRFVLQNVLQSNQIAELLISEFHN
jgi:hypothetical protein